MVRRANRTKNVPALVLSSSGTFLVSGRADRIRTCDPLTPLAPQVCVLHGTSSFALSPLVRHATRRRRGLPLNGPRPLCGVDITHPAARYLTNASRGACCKGHHVAPSAVVIRGPVHQSVSEHRQRNPRRQRKGARVVEFILRTLVFLLPTANPRRIAQVPPFPKEKRKGLLIA
jgi:hypothetical protein